MADQGPETNDPTPTYRKLLRFLERVPFFVRLIVVVIAVFLGSAGYFKSQWDKSHLDEDADINTELLDVTPKTTRTEPIEAQFRAASGDIQKLSQLRGSVVIVDFWASWCEPCLTELASFKKLYESMKGDGLKIVPINLDDNPFPSKAAMDLWQDQIMPFETFFDSEDRKFANQFGVESLPTVFVLDRKGRLAMAGAGSNDWSADVSVASLRELLKE